MEQPKTIELRRGKDAGLARRHPWIFSGAVGRVPRDLQEGEVVRVVDADGRFLCTGHWGVGSIVVRVLSFSDRPIDEQFYRERLAQAVALRKALHLFRPDNTICRLVHGEGDGLAGLIIDIYGETAVMQAHSVGMHRDRTLIARALVSIATDIVKAVYYKSDGTLPYKAALSEQEGWIVGGNGQTDAPEKHIALENGLKFSIDWLHGQKTGFFVDQRDSRSLLERYSPNRRVLNMFCYTGGFSIYALRGGAREVVSVDSSARAIDSVAENVKLNFGECGRAKQEVADAFEFLEKTGREWDLMIVDPPAFAKHREAVRNALKGYTRLNRLAFEKTQPGGIMFTFSCSQAINKEQFRLAVFTAAAQAGREVSILHQLHQPSDHPISIYHPEGEYLKGLVLSVR